MEAGSEFQFFELMGTNVLANDFIRKHEKAYF